MHEFDTQKTLKSSQDLYKGGRILIRIEILLREILVKNRARLCKDSPPKTLKNTPVCGRLKGLLKYNNNSMSAREIL